MAHPHPSVVEGIVYSDGLIEMNADGILFKRYSFPYGPRRMLFADVERIVAQEPSLWNGKYASKAAAIFGPGLRWIGVEPHVPRSSP